MQMLCWTFMLAATWSSGTCPGPSTMTCTLCAQARFVSSPRRTSSSIWHTSVASARHPGRHASPSEMVTSYSSQISRISSEMFIERIFFSGHAHPCKYKTSSTAYDIHFTFVFLICSIVFRVIPQCSVTKSTPSSA